MYNLTMLPFTHCPYCGHAFDPQQPWPRLCAGCSKISYLNPLPVVVVMLPVDGGLLAVRRAIPPHLGRLALPGGYINLGETWQQAFVRETREETGLTISLDEARLFDVQSAHDGSLLIFATARPRSLNPQTGALTLADPPPECDPSLPARCDLPGLRGDGESSECCIIYRSSELAWQLHGQAAERFFRHGPGLWAEEPPLTPHQDAPPPQSHWHERE